MCNLIKARTCRTLVLVLTVLCVCCCYSKPEHHDWGTFYEVALAYFQYEKANNGPPPLDSDWIGELAKFEPDLKEMVSESSPFHLNKVKSCKMSFPEV